MPGALSLWLLDHDEVWSVKGFPETAMGQPGTAGAFRWELQSSSFPKKALQCFNNSHSYTSAFCLNVSTALSSQTPHTVPTAVAVHC